MAEWVPPGAVPADSSEWVPPGAVPAAQTQTPVRSNPLPGMAKGLETFGINSIPMLAAFAGAAIGNIPGATIGAMGGEAIRQNLNRAVGNPAPATPRAALNEIGRAGVGQGLARLGGTTVAASMEPLAAAAIMPLQSAMMNLAVNAPIGVKRSAVSIASARKGMAALPGEANIGRQMVTERVGATGGGLQKVRGIISQADAKLTELAASADKAGWAANADDFLKHLGDLEQQVGRQTDAALQLSRLRKMVNGFKKSRSKPSSASETLELKRTWQKAANAIYKAKERGGVVGPRADLLGRLNETVARGAREKMQEIPGVAQQNARMQELMPTEKAIEAALLRSGNPFIPRGARLMAGGLGGAIGAAAPGDYRSRGIHGAEGFLLGALMGTPQMMSRSALAIDSPAAQWILTRLGPAALAEIQRQTGAPPDVTGR